jgi:hypothetical protein
MRGIAKIIFENEKKLKPNKKMEKMKMGMRKRQC